MDKLERFPFVTATKKNTGSDYDHVPYSTSAIKSMRAHVDF